MVSTSLGSTTDLVYEIRYDERFMPERSPRANVKRVVIEDETVLILRNHATGEFYEIDELTNLIWSRIDGTRTIHEIHKEAVKELGRVSLESVRGTLVFFANEKLLKIPAQERIRKSRVEVVSPFEIDVNIVSNGSRLIGRFHRVLKPLFQRPLLWFGLAFIFASCVVFANDFIGILHDQRNFQILGSTIVGYFFYYFVLLFPVIVVHELSHGLALKHYGGDPGEIGTGLFYFGPMFYVDTSAAWALGKWERVMVSMGGPISTLLIGSVSVVLSRLSIFSPEISRVFSMLAFWCFYVMLFNFNPLFETDGYYALMDIVNIPNLREESFHYVKTVLMRLLHRPIDELPIQYKRRQIVILTAYAVASAVYLPLFVYSTFLILSYMGGNFVAASAWIYNSIGSRQAVGVSDFAVNLASLAYFGMTLVGFGLMAKSVMRNARIGGVKFEAVDDRKAAVFLYLPPATPKKLVDELGRKIRRVCKKLAANSDAAQVGSSFVVLLRLGSVDLPLSEIMRDIRKAELAFRSTYERFLLKRGRLLLRTLGAYSQEKLRLTKFLKRLAVQISRTPGRKDSKTIVGELLRVQEATLTQLLLSTFGTACTLALSPEEYETAKKAWLPSQLIEDLSVTHLHGTMEQFRKNTVFGQESLTKLTNMIEQDVRKIFSHPEKYQASAIFEPIKNRLILLGRTGEIDKNLPNLGALFFYTAWTGYFNHALGEMSLRLKVVGKLAESLKYDKKRLEGLSDGEVATLNRNLAYYVTNDQLITRSLEELEHQLNLANEQIDRFRSNTDASSVGFHIGFLETITQLSIQKMQGIAEELPTVGQEAKKLHGTMSKLLESVRKEDRRRRPRYARMRRKILAIYPFVLAASAVLLLSDVLLDFLHKIAAIPAIAILLFTLVLLHGGWSLAYYANWRHFNQPGHYQNPDFDTIQLFTMAATQAIYPLAATQGILTVEKKKISSVESSRRGTA
jgi:hypothetical protein